MKKKTLAFAISLMMLAYLTGCGSTSDKNTVQTNENNTVTSSPTEIGDVTSAANETPAGSESLTESPEGNLPEISEDPSNDPTGNGTDAPVDNVNIGNNTQTPVTGTDEGDTLTGNGDAGTSDGNANSNEVPTPVVTDGVTAYPTTGTGNGNTGSTGNTATVTNTPNGNTGSAGNTGNSGNTGTGTGGAVTTPTNVPSAASTKAPVPTKAPTKVPTKTPTKTPTKAPTATNTPKPTESVRWIGTAIGYRDVKVETPVYVTTARSSNGTLVLWEMENDPYPYNYLFSQAPILKTTYGLTPDDIRDWLTEDSVKGLFIDCCAIINETYSTGVKYQTGTKTTTEKKLCMVGDKYSDGSVKYWDYFDYTVTEKWTNKTEKELNAMGYYFE